MMEEGESKAEVIDTVTKELVEERKDKKRRSRSRERRRHRSLSSSSSPRYRRRRSSSSCSGSKRHRSSRRDHKRHRSSPRREHRSHTHRRPDKRRGSSSSEKIQAPKVKLEPKGQMLPTNAGGVYMPPFKMKAMLEQLRMASTETEEH